MNKPGWQCPLCGRVSYHPEDAANRYCSCCGGPYLPKQCPHQHEARWEERDDQ
jgi:ribosomal protein L37E